MKRMIVACAVAVLAVGSLTACGGGSSDDSAGNASGGTSSETSSESGGNGAGGGTGDYCAAIQDAKQKFGSVNFDATDLGDAVNTIHEIAGQAPDSVSAEWATVDDALTQLVNALADAGLDPSDLNPSAMESLAADPQQLHELQKISKSFDSQALTDAGNKIDDEVKADCGFSLSASH
jgi:ABC-type glycerol-3-phosphate transport system substrate-binding protein